MLEIEKQIRAYGQTRNTADLQSYVADLDVEEVYRFMNTYCYCLV